MWFVYSMHIGRVLSTISCYILIFEILPGSKQNTLSNNVPGRVLFVGLGNVSEEADA